MDLTKSPLTAPLDSDQPTKTYLDSQRVPTLVLPPKSCDSHFHIFGPASSFPYSDKRNFTPVDAPKEKLFALHQRVGIERGVIVHTALHGFDLRVTEDAIAHGGGRYVGIALVEPSVSQTELLRLKAAGFRGVRFNFMKHLPAAMPAGDLVKFCERLADIDMHLQVHFEKELIASLAPTFASCAKLLPVVLDHMGRVDARNGLTGEHYSALCRLMDEPNFYVKVSGIDRIDDQPPYLAGKQLAADLVQRYPEQCLWGLDWPHPNHTHVPDDVTLVEALIDIAPSPAALETLLVHNPQRLFQFED